LGCGYWAGIPITQKASFNIKVKEKQFFLTQKLIIHLFAWKLKKPRRYEGEINYFLLAKDIKNIRF